MFGLLCTDSLENVGHSMFMNYRLALYNYFDSQNFIEVRNKSDLNGITHLFIVDEHFPPNADIWSQTDFINTINNKNIRVIIFNSEKIYISCFPWNVILQQKVQSLKSYHQFVCDIDEAKMFNATIINKFFISKNLNFNIPINENKLEKILFIGQIEGEQYSKRRLLLEKIQANNIPIDIFNSKRKYTYKEILTMYNNYKYVLCPIGTGKWFSYRHYEVTHLKSIPIQEVTDEMIPWFEELQATSIFFKEPSEIKNKIENFQRIDKEIMLEEYFNKINLCKFI